MTNKKMNVNKSEGVSNNTTTTDSEADKIWTEIKDKEIFMFGLPDQKVINYCKPSFVEPTKLYLLTTASAVLPSLEVAVGSSYKVDAFDKYVVVSRA